MVLLRLTTMVVQSPHRPIKLASSSRQIFCNGRMTRAIRGILVILHKGHMTIPFAFLSAMEKSPRLAEWTAVLLANSGSTYMRGPIIIAKRTICGVIQGSSPATDQLGFLF